MADALELLSPAFQHPALRKYAVARLQQADDEVWLPYKQNLNQIHVEELGTCTLW